MHRRDHGDKILRRDAAHDAGGGPQNITAARRNLKAVFFDLGFDLIRVAFTSRTVTKETKAKKLQEFLGVGGKDMTLGGMFQQAISMASKYFKRSRNP